MRSVSGKQKIQRRMRNMALIIIIVPFFTFGQRNLPGFYRINFSWGGKSNLSILLNRDSTFVYSFPSDKSIGMGDIYLNFAIGTFHYHHKYIFLGYDSIRVDTNNKTYQFDQSDTAYLPTRFIYKNKKLWIIDKEGNVVKYSPCVSRFKQFIFFGDHYVTKRKYYFKKEKNSNLAY
jgi:hypothetical protein